MRVLTMTSLYPSAARPRHGAFVEARIAAMQRLGSIEPRVVAPVPWFPFDHPRFGAYAGFARTPRVETRLGIEVRHPRYFTVPGAGMYVQPFAMAIAAARAARQIARAGFVPDVVDAHYFYPDGVAAALVARRLRKPLVITARGSDVNLLGQIAWPRRLIRWAAGQAQCIVTVSAALAETLHSLGVDGNKISVVRNGVDADRFAPVDRAQARQRLELADDVPLIVSIGNLVPEKGHDLVIDALVHVPDARLLVVGDGPQRDRLLRRIDAQRLGSRAMLLPAMAQQELCWIYGAADVVALASIREGLPNVLLEALACGTRVVAMRVGGVPEIVTEPVAGRLVEDRSAVAFARSLCDILGSRPTAAQTRAFAARFDWSATARGHVAALERAIALHAHRVRDARPATAGRDA